MRILTLLGRVKVYCWGLASIPCASIKYEFFSPVGEEIWKQQKQNSNNSMTENIGSAVDPLAEACGGINTDFPVLMPDRILEFKIASAKKKHNEQSNADSLELKVELTKDAVFRDGKTARSGFKFNQYIGVSPSENYTFDDIKRNIALWVKATYGVAAAQSIPARDIVENPAKLEGRVFNGRTGVKKDKTGTYADSTSVTPIIPA